MINNIYQAKYKTIQLRRTRVRDDFEKLISIYSKTGLDIYPHQIVAAVSALANPFSKGFMLCDEVGLGKGVEAMLVISQLYYEAKRRIAIIVPQPLLEQWKGMLDEQFDIPFSCFDEVGKIDLEDMKDKVLLSSYNFASEHYEELKDITWDLAVFEEAHRLRKFYTNENKTANNLHSAFENTRKLLLTATPMQKNVMDLYGLINFIDDSVFDDPDEFYKRYYKKPENYPELRKKLEPYTFRTLRNQVKLEINLPNRNILTHEYELEDEREKELNRLITQYIMKPKKVAFPDMDPYELNLMLQKLFSSSFYAISKTFAGIHVRLNKMVGEEAQKEAAEIRKMLDLSTSIIDTSKSKAFLKVLEQAFKSLSEKGLKKKIVIFTENTQTQEYLQKLIGQKTRYRAVIYNGSTGEKPLDEFKNKANILITTDNGNEGFNFEYCNFIINYDNPWNILSLEQRIGRCHRIGQKNEVFVVYFICREIFADVRFYELAFKRMNMFDGILGTSDNVVSDVTSGKAGENVANMVLNARNQSEIEAEFKELQEEYKDYIENNKKQTNEMLFSTFDESIVKKTKNYVEIIKKRIAEEKELLWQVTKYALRNKAVFDEENRSFRLTQSLYKSGNIFNFNYYMNFDKDTPKSERYTMLNRDTSQILSFIELAQTVSGRLSLIGNKSSSGLIGLYKLSYYTNYSYCQDFVCVGVDSEGKILSNDECQQILNLECSSAEERYFDREFRADYLKEEQINELNDTLNIVLPDLEKEFKENSNALLNDEIKHIQAITDNKKYRLKLDIEKLEKELAKAKRNTSGSNNAEFISNQQIAEMSKKLLKLKENEFMTKLKLNKEEKEQIENLHKNFTPKITNSDIFMLYYNISDKN